MEAKKFFESPCGECLMLMNERPCVGCEMRINDFDTVSGIRELQDKCAGSWL